MKKIIEDLRNKLTSGIFEKEEHVRLCIVARICQELGWDIWNPSEFYTEFPIKLKTKEGSIDVALFHSDLKDRTPDVFFEVKAVGKLKGNIESSEDQLQEYNYYNTASITILTDGKIWRFYLSSAPGTFSQRMFCSFNMQEDKDDYVIEILQNVLAKKRFTRDAVNAAEKMLRDLKLSKEVDRARHEANHRSDEHPDLNKYQLVQLVLTERGQELSLEEIKRLWDIKSTEKEPTGGHEGNGDNGSAGGSHGGDQSEVFVGNVTDDFTYRKIKRIFVIDQWHDVKYWWEAKKVIYDRFHDKLKSANLPKNMGISLNKDDFQEAFKLPGGFYAEGHGSANTIIKHIKRALQVVGYDAAAVVQIEASKSKTTERNYGK